jgi:acetylornithine deacetylase/succinyl-diaminopimelate desuccinylase-like protein
MPSFEDSADYLPELAEFVAIPSVSRDSNPPDMRAAAQWLAGQLAFANARLLETDGNPVVAGQWLGAPGAPTVLVYGHYDVQPTGSLDEWRTPPFELTVADGKAYGRGATDDKGPILVVLKTAQAFLHQSGGLPLNVKFLFEGEEEIGSPNLPAFLRANAEQFAADLVISADGAQWRPTEPSVSIASKGLAALDITVAGAGRDLHSGRYGGTVQNPVHALARLLAGLHDDGGRVAVPGFYDGVPDLTAQERA